MHTHIHIYIYIYTHSKYVGGGQDAPATWQDVLRPLKDNANTNADTKTTNTKILVLIC